MRRRKSVKGDKRNAVTKEEIRDKCEKNGGRQKRKTVMDTTLVRGGRNAGVAMMEGICEGMRG